MRTMFKSVVFALFALASVVHAGDAVTDLAKKPVVIKPFPVSRPVGGEVYVIGTHQTIVGGKVGTPIMIVELSRDGGKTFTTIGQVSNKGLKAGFKNTFNWTVTGPASSNCVVRLSGIYCKKPYIGVSNVFSIGNDEANETGVAGPAGADGKDGATGPQGPAGPVGPAPNPNDIVNLLVNDNAFLTLINNNLDTNPSFITDVVDALVLDANFYDVLVQDLITNETFIAETKGAKGDQGVAGPAGATGAKGSTGAQGPQGPQGAAGAQGPQGVAGPQGPAGSKGCNFRGNYSITINYIIGDVCFYNGSVYICIANNTNCGCTNTTYWNVFCSKGNDGNDGAVGPAGPAGPQGPAGAAGAKGATGANGAQGVQGVAGPQGPQGATGPQGPAGNSILTSAVFCRNLTSTSQEHDETITNASVKSNSVIICQFIDTGNNNNNCILTIRAQSAGSFKVHVLASCQNFQLTDGISYIVVNP